MAIGSDGTLWIGNSFYGLTSFDGNNWVNYHTTNSDIPFNIIGLLTIDNDGYLWILGRESEYSTQELVQYTGTDWITHQTPLSITTREGTTMTSDNDGNVWIGSHSGGLYKFDGSNWTSINTSNSGLASNYISSIDVQDSNRIWICSRWLHLFDGNNWITYDTSNSGLTHAPYDLTIDVSGEIWISSSYYISGITSYDGTNWINYNSSNSGIPQTWFHAIACESNGVVWLATSGDGLVSFDGENWMTYDVTNWGWNHNSVSTILIDEYGTKWLGSGSDLGLISFDGENWQLYNSSNSGFSGWVCSLASGNNGEIWIGTWGQGVTTFDGENWFTYNSTNSVLPEHCYTFSIKVDKNDIVWFGTSDGLVKFDGTNWTTWNPENSLLPYYIIPSLEVDNFGTVWMSNYVNFDEGMEWGAHGLSGFNENGIPSFNIPETPNTPEQLFIYPNPAQTTITIQTDNQPISEIKIYNLTGQLVLKKRPSGNQVDVSGLKDGLYVIECLVGDRLYRQKLVVRK
jgi:ligand-binding sensor domain-containing protein